MTRLVTVGRRAHAMGQRRLSVTATQQPARAAAMALTMDDARPCVLCRRPSGSTSPARPNAAGSAVGRAECGSRPVGRGRRVLMLNRLVYSSTSVSRGQSQGRLITTHTPPLPSPPPQNTHTYTHHHHHHHRCPKECGCVNGGVSGQPELGLLPRSCTHHARHIVLDTWGSSSCSCVHSPTT